VGPVPGRLRGRPFILPGDDPGEDRTVVDDTGVRRHIRTIPYTNEQAREWIERGEAIRMSRYDQTTLVKSRDHLKKFEKFRETWPIQGSTENEILSAYVGFLEARQNQSSQEPLKANTVSNYMWHLAKGLEYFRGTKLEENLHYQQLQRGLRSQFTPTTKAIPLRWQAVRRIATESRLTLPARALTSALWLSAQRPGNVLDVKRRDVYDDGKEIHVWYTTKRKGSTLIDRLLPPKHIWSPSPLLDVIRHYLQVYTNRENLFMESDYRELRAYLKELTVVETAPPVNIVKWRATYTPYSIKRGALQHLAAWGNDFEKISCLSLHRRLDTLAIYIGSFLNPKALETRELTKMLTLEPVVTPREFPEPRRNVQSTQVGKTTTTQTEPNDHRVLISTGVSPIRLQISQMVQTMTPRTIRAPSPEPIRPVEGPKATRGPRMCLGLIDPLAMRESTPEIPNTAVARRRSRRGQL
jgi:integrase